MSLVLVGRRVYRLLDPKVGEKVYLLNIDPSVDATYVPTGNRFVESIYVLKCVRVTFFGGKSFRGRVTG
jgi:hypothetical protein